MMKKAQREREMFGCTEHDLETFVRRYVGNTALPLGFKSCKDAAKSILSDAQEEIAMGNGEHARKAINRAKWLLDR